MFPSMNATGTDGAGAVAQLLQMQQQQQPLPGEEYSSSARPRWKKPKRGMTAYNYFFQEERIRILNEREPASSSSSSDGAASLSSADSVNSSISSGSMLRKQSADSSQPEKAGSFGACSVCPSCSGEIVPSSPKGDGSLPSQTQPAQKRQGRPVKEVLNHEESGTLSRLSSSSEDRPSSTTSDDKNKKSNSKDKSTTSSSPSNNGSESGSNNGKESSSSSNGSSSNNAVGGGTKRPPRYVSASSAASSSESNPDSATSIAGSSGADGDISSSEYGGPSSASSSQASTTGGSSSDDDESRTRSKKDNKTKSASPTKGSTTKKGDAAEASPASSNGADAKGHHSSRKRKMCTCHTRPSGAKASGGTGASVGATAVTSSSTSTDAAAAVGAKKARVVAPDDAKSIGAKSAATNASTSARSSRSKRKKPHGKISFRDLNQEISKRWKTVSKEDMARYKAMAEKDAARYRKEMKQYQQEKIAAMSMIRGGMLQHPAGQSPAVQQGPRVAFQVQQQQQLPQQAPAFTQQQQQQQPALAQPMGSNVAPSMQMGLSQEQFSALPSDIQSLLVQYYQMKDAQNQGQPQMQPQQPMVMQAQPDQLAFQQPQQQQQAMPPAGMSQEQMQIMSLQQQQAQLMNQLAMLQSGGNTPALGVTPGSSQLASASQSYATLPASNTTGQFQQPQIQNTSNEVFPSMPTQQHLNTQAQAQPRPQSQTANQQMNAPSFAMPTSSNNNDNEMEMSAGVSEQFMNSNAFLQKVLEDNTKKRSPDMNGAAAWGATAQPEVAAATGASNIHVHHANLSHQQKQPSSANNNPARRQESCLSLGVQSKNGSDSLNLSDISSNFSISSLTTLTSLKQDGTKKDEVSDISTSGSDEKKKSAGAESPPESDESGAKQARSRKRQHSEDNEPETSNKKVRVVDPAALEGKPCISKRDSGELSSESSWTSSNDDDNNDGGAYFSGMSTAKGLSVVKQQRSYNSEVSSVSASGSDRGSDDGLSKEENNA